MRYARSMGWPEIHSRTVPSFSRVTGQHSPRNGSSGASGGGTKDGMGTSSRQGLSSIEWRLRPARELKLQELMNREPSPFSDEDDLPEPLPKLSNKRQAGTSRAEVLGWFAAVFSFAAVAWVLLFPSVQMETRAVLSLVCLLIGAAFFVAAYRQLD